MKPTTPPPVSERFRVPAIDCNFASGLMLKDKATGTRTKSAAAVRALRAASKALHAATGPTDLVAAYRNRYGWKVVPFAGSWATLLAKMRSPSMYAGAVLYILPARLPKRYRRWDPGFNEGHAIYCQATSPSGSKPATKVWIIDPMLADHETGYRGEWIDTAVLYKALMPGVRPVMLKQGEFHA